MRPASAVKIKRFFLSMRTLAYPDIFPFNSSTFPYSSHASDCQYRSLTSGLHQIMVNCLVVLNLTDPPHEFICLLRGESIFITKRKTHALIANSLLDQCECSSRHCQSQFIAKRAILLSRCLIHLKSEIGHFHCLRHFDHLLIQNIASIHVYFKCFSSANRRFPHISHLNRIVQTSPLCSPFEKNIFQWCQSATCLTIFSPRPFCPMLDSHS